MGGGILYSNCSIQILWEGSGFLLVTLLPDLCPFPPPYSMCEKLQMAVKVAKEERQS